MCSFTSVGRDAPAPAANAADWFRGLTGAEYPAPQALAGLHPVRRNVWASHVKPDTKVDGLPQFLTVRPAPIRPEVLRVLGYAGRGINRQAIYYTILDGRHDIRLRLRFGGVLMDPDEGREAVTADLALVEWIHARAAHLPVRCTIRFGLGDREIRVVALTGRHRKLYECFLPRPSFSGAAVREALERVLVG